MTRLVARLVLAMLLLPLTGTLVVLSMVAIAPTGPPQALPLVGMWAFVYAFVGTYWILLWRAVVRWNPARKVQTALSGLVALGIGAAMGWFIAMLASAPLEMSILFGGGSVPIVWVLATVLIWRETRQERFERIAAAGTDTLGCPICGYNMTGLREARCPECGTQFTLDQLLTSQPQRDHVLDDQ